MSIWFAVNHACATAPIVYATSILDSQVGYAGNAVLYLCSMISALLVAVLAVDITGLRGGLVLGMSLYSVYVASFTASALLTQSVALQWALFIFGSACDGFGAGILWTAEGGYMALSATAISELTGEKREAVTGSLAGQFAFYYLILEVVVKLLFSFLQNLGLQVWQIGLLYTSVSCLATFMMTSIDNLGLQVNGKKDEQVEKKSTFAKLFAAVSLWGDPKIWLLSPTNITFGFSAAYLNGYFNSHFATAELGAKSIGTLTSVTVLSAAVLSQAYGVLSKRLGKGIVITVGAMSFLAIPCILLLAPCCEGWGWKLLMFYVLQGSGRAVYESTNKAVFSDFFVGKDTDGAFANCALQMSVSSATLFFLSSAFDGKLLAKLEMFSAVITPLVYAITVQLQKAEHRTRTKEYKPVDPASDSDRKPSPRR